MYNKKEKREDSFSDEPPRWANFFGVSVSETMAARGHVNGRGPRRRRGRDSAKRVVSDTDTPKKFPEERTIDKMYADNDQMCIFMPKVVVFVSVFDGYAYQIELFS